MDKVMNFTALPHGWKCKIVLSGGEPSEEDVAATLTPQRIIGIATMEDGSVRYVVALPHGALAVDRVPIFDDEETPTYIVDTVWLTDPVLEVVSAIDQHG